MSTALLVAPAVGCGPVEGEEIPTANPGPGPEAPPVSPMEPATMEPATMEPATMDEAIPGPGEIGINPVAMQPEPTAMVTSTTIGADPTATVNPRGTEDEAPATAMEETPAPPATGRIGVAPVGNPRPMSMEERDALRAERERRIEAARRARSGEE